MREKQLKPYAVSEDLFNEILAAGYNIKIVSNPDEFNKYKFGYDNKRTIIYDGVKAAILLECVLNEHYPLNKELTYWKQCVIHKDTDTHIECEDDIDGAHATMFMKGLICQYYTIEEYKKCMAEHTAVYDKNLAQYHFSIYEESKKIIRYDNCYKWDINGAHTDALCEIFPKAAPAIQQLHNQRKISPINKKYINYYVGTMASTGYRGTYNWIVQRTTRKLLEGINAVGGDLLYANTDGFMVMNPDNILPHSTKLGEFKLEYNGPTWFYYDTNYQCFQTETGEIKGTILRSVRDKIDLPHGKVVHYTRKKKYDNVFVAEDIREEIVNVSSTSLW